MKSRSRAVAAALLFMCGVTALAQQPTFRSNTRTVALYATALDDKKRLIPDLTQQDFEIFDNDKPQAIDLFVKEVQPITVVVMLDTSASMTGNLKLLEQAAEQFLLRLLPKDKGMVGAFNDKIEFFPATFTHDRDRLIASLKELDFGNPTRLYDAVAASMDRLLKIDGRRVVLVFTDGDDTGSRENVGSVLESARENEVMIYAIGLRSDYFNGSRQVRSRPDGGLRRLAEETGGGYFELELTSDLAPTFTRVAQELHSQYVLGFTPLVLDGKVHRLTVRTKRPGTTVRARRSYLASVETN
ncbi:MAG TPA: VWA domain-containing protein [Vicinamibacterales bacterium]|nr:VWA domain-containing protein [Vicinamibacterales bacterium]